MKNEEAKIREKLMTEDEEFKTLSDEHAKFEKQLDKFNSQLHLTPKEEMERKKIQKLKLAGRDKMETIVSNYGKK